MILHRIELFPEHRELLYNVIEMEIESIINNNCDAEIIFLAKEILLSIKNYTEIEI